jgi:hypothetical protein
MGVFLGTEILYVPCDAGAQEEEICRKSRVQITPTLVIGGARFEGYRSVPQLREAMDIPANVARRLAERQAVVYGRESCVWTARQKLALGPHFGKLEYVDCDSSISGKRRCASAGVSAVPAWSLDGSPPIAGYQPLPALAQLALADAAELKRRHEATRGGASGTC